MSSLAHFRDTLARAGLEDCVVPVLTRSELAAQVVTGPVSFVFIDGGHSMAAAMADYRNWATRVMTGGTLAIHDVFPDPAEGGRPPFEIYRLAMNSGLFEEIDAVHSLRLLRRL
jgi:predicted O-methyltransferase YrrM